MPTHLNASSYGRYASDDGTSLSLENVNCVGQDFFVEREAPHKKVVITEASHVSDLGSSPSGGMFLHFWLIERCGLMLCFAAFCSLVDDWLNENIMCSNRLLTR